MGKSCCIVGCEVSSPDAEYFKFPRSGSLLASWVEATGAGGGDVCSAHFTDNDYKCMRGQRRLLGTAVPSVFPRKPPSTTENGEIASTNTKIKNVKAKSRNKKVKEKKSIEIQKPDSTTDNDTGDTTRSSKSSRDKIEETIDKNKAGIDKNSGVTEIEKSGDRESSQDSVDTGTDGVSEKIPYNAPTEVNDIEDMITNYQIKQTKTLADRLNPEPLEDLIPTIMAQESTALRVNQPPQPTANQPSQTSQITPNKLDVSQLASHLSSKLDHKLAEIMAAAPVFIEVAVDQDVTRTESPEDCLMLLESVQCDVDPSSLMLPEHGPDTDSDMEIIDADLPTKVHRPKQYPSMRIKPRCTGPSSTLPCGSNRDQDGLVKLEHAWRNLTCTPTKKEDPNPISLLTSSDEDEVIIQEPHIDTVEVSDETDEDDKPLQTLIRPGKPKPKADKSKKGNYEWGYEFYCGQCDFRTNDESEFKQHNLDLAHLHSTTIQICPTCNYTTASKAQFSRHKRKHRDERNFKCHLCHYKARHNMSLIYHLKCHAPVEKKRNEKFTCDKCGFSSNVKSEALKHVKLKSCEGGSRYTCDQCSYSTKRRSDLRRHRMRRHSVDDSDEDYTI